MTTNKPAKTAAKKPAAKSRKAKSGFGARMFEGNMNFHACIISTGQKLEIPDVERQISFVVGETMKFVLDFILKSKLDPNDVHLAFEVSADTNDHPATKTSPDASKLVN